ncbi:sugar-binding domain-containing protein [Candidatus Riflebacteria bacterium]
MREINLNGTWELCEGELYFSEKQVAGVSRKKKGWLKARVPGCVHESLIKSGRITEPLEGLNNLDCAWVEEHSWWYRKSFDIKKGWLQQADKIELFLQSLDAGAAIFLNNSLLGRHINAHRPAVFSVKKYLKPGKNSLLIRLSTGVEEVTEEDLDSMTVKLFYPQFRGEERRCFVRKAQYSFGWDWAPRIPSIAITGNVTLRFFENACIRDISVQPIRDGKNVRLRIVSEIEKFHYFKSQQGTLEVSVTNEVGEREGIKKDILLRSGQNYVEMVLSIKKPRLWWPNGLGEQHLYSLVVQFKSSGEKKLSRETKFGIRFIELLDVGEFAFEINGKKIFCKGANWVPADALYARVDRKKLEVLLKEAVRANFNMLRVWGGGIYEADEFYELCDRYGILVWQDFMFACAPYPDHLNWFCEEVEKEASYQTERLRNHPSLALWCGSNENLWGFVFWWNERTRSGAKLYNYILPSIVHKNCPHIPYWNCSPYGGSDTPNSNRVGNVHHWDPFLLTSKMHLRTNPKEYDRCRAFFISEYGYIGPCLQKNTTRYLGSRNIKIGDTVWEHHTGRAERGVVSAGIKKHYADPEKLAPGDYLLFGGLCQGMILGYSLESFRFRPECRGGLFWMFNDAWGEVGWSIIDYYLTRKISYYYVKRAFAPIRLIMREIKKGIICVVLANDTAVPVSGTIEFGYTDFSGSQRHLSRQRVTCPALTQQKIVSFEKDLFPTKQGLWYAKFVKREDIIPSIFWGCDFRKMVMLEPQLSWDIIEKGKTVCRLEVKSKNYAHAVHLNFSEKTMVSDNYFDLLPGESRKIVIEKPGKLALENIKYRAVFPQNLSNR